MADDSAAGFAECRRILAESDAERAVSLAFAPAGRQDGLAALYAFDIEAGRIRGQVSQPMPGEIRLQWWRDRIANPADKGQGSPVAHALVETIERFILPASAFERYLEARIFDLYDDPVPGQAEFEAYAGETTATIIMLAGLILDRDEAPMLADAAGHAGVALLATDLLRREALFRQLRQHLVPGDILAAAGVDHTAWAAGGAGLEPARLAIAAYAREHLSAMKRSLPGVPRSLRPALLPAIGCRRWLDAIEKGQGSSGVDAPAAGRAPHTLGRIWSFWRAMRA